MPTTSLAQPTLHLLCGKIAAGKSTLSAKLMEAPNTILVSEDTWLAALYGEQMQSVADYVACSGKLKKALTPHLVSLLRNGLSVVLDFPANTLANRQWMKSIVDEAGADNRLHYLDVPDDVCRERLRARNSSGTHDFAATDAQFDLITSYFVAPDEREGLTIIRYT
ncbi:ATP-binding protein [Cedecea neteri]|uniref:AAA family ATPase n=1 Tax=Cedecea neteri TaxID=158822 RepID=UPI0028931DF2|nr:ATP-binding protein [Cedecea neteri]WNJ81858.1 ATP-binding protein [Cedecea neteri]